MYAIEWQEFKGRRRFSKVWVEEPWETTAPIPEVGPRLDPNDIKLGSWEQTHYRDDNWPNPGPISKAQASTVESRTRMDDPIEFSEIAATFREEMGRSIDIHYGKHSLVSKTVAPCDEIPWHYSADPLEIFDLQRERPGRNMDILCENPKSVAWYRTMRAQGVDPFEVKRWKDVVDWQEIVDPSMTWLCASEDELTELK